MQFGLYLPRRKVGVRRIVSEEPHYRVFGNRGKSARRLTYGVKDIVKQIGRQGLAQEKSPVLVRFHGLTYLCFSMLP